jgi:hypothetical protein
MHRQADYGVTDDTLSNSGSKNGGTTRPTRRTAAGKRAQPAEVSMIMGAERLTTGRKRSFSDITEDIEVVLSDGRRGTYKPSKWGCLYQIECIADGVSENTRAAGSTQLTPEARTQRTGSG